MITKKGAGTGTPLVIRIRVQTMAETAILILDSSAAGIQAGETAAAVAAEEIEKEGACKDRLFCF